MALQSALAALQRHHSIADLISKSSPGGSQDSLVAGSALLARQLREVRSPSSLVLTNGAQNALLVLFRGLIGRGGVLLAERLSYTPLKRLAAMADVRLVGLEIDEEGVRPESLERACREHSPRALYCNPTVQNPTTATSSLARRHELIELMRRFSLPIIEDDALGLLHPEAPPPLAALAPDITWYVATLTKCLAQGMRLAYVAAPGAPDLQKVFGEVAALSYWHPAPLSEALLGHMLASGSAATVTAAIARESERREEIAQTLLKPWDIRSQRGSMHVWLTLPPRCPRAQFASAARANGVALRVADVFATDDGEAPNAIRLSLSAARNREEVTRGLRLLTDLLSTHR